jgi:uncharacterized protein (UPF0332 family)
VTKEQKELLIQAELDTKTAEECLAKGQLRAACSRGYYSMFYIVRAIMLSDELEFSKHSGLISAFGKRVKVDPAISSSFHKEILFAFKRRGSADYDFDVKVEVDDVQRIVKSAKQFIELGERIVGAVAKDEE